MKLKFPWLKSQMIRACMDFAEMRLWEHYDNMDFFVVQTPLEEPVVASIMGAGGQEYGLSVFRGSNAFRQPLMLYDRPRSAVDKINTIGFGMMYYKDMDHSERKWLKSCNYKASKSEWVPSVLFKKPGRMMEMVEKDHDVKLMLYILKGIMQAQEDGDFCPTTEGAVDSKIMTIDVSGNVLEPDVSVKRRSFPGSKELLDLCNQDELFEDDPLSADVSGLPRLDQTWVIVPVYVSGADSTHENCIFTIAEEDSHYVLHAEAIAMDVAEMAEILYDVFAGDNDAGRVGIPRKIIVAEKECFDAISVCLKEWDIDACYPKNHPVAAELRKNLREYLPAFLGKHIMETSKMTDMLQGIDGIRYIGHENRDVQDMLEKAPETQDAVEEAVPEEVLAAARDRIKKHYIDWLDIPIPILDNKTPRQFARSKKGAQKIKKLIETIPAPMNNPDMEIPRKEMLRELGLGEKL